MYLNNKMPKMAGLLYVLVSISFSYFCIKFRLKTFVCLVNLVCRFNILNVCGPLQNGCTMFD